jgi:hypothetical protein
VQVPTPAEKPSGTPPTRPPTCEILQTSTSPTAEYNESLDRSVTKVEETRASVRRQLLKDNVEEEASFLLLNTHITNHVGNKNPASILSVESFP